MEQKGTKSSVSAKEINPGNKDKNPLKDVNSPQPVVISKFNNNQSQKETRDK